MFNSIFLESRTNLIAFFLTVRARLTSVEKKQAYPYKVTTGADGTATIDYTALGLSSPPNIDVTAQLSAVGDTPVSTFIVGEPTNTMAKIIVKRVGSIAGLGLAPSWNAVASVKVHVLVKPN